MKKMGGLFVGSLAQLLAKNELAGILCLWVFWGSAGLGLSEERVWPKDQELVVVMAEDCSLQVGNQLLCKIPARTVLPIKAEQNGFCSVKYKGKEGWIPWAKCFRIGKNPVAETFCRKGLARLTEDNMEQVAINFFIAASLDPDDNSYKTFLTSLTRFANLIQKARSLAAEAANAHTEAQQKKENADFFRNAKGFGDSFNTGLNTLERSHQAVGQEKTAEADSAGVRARDADNAAGAIVGDLVKDMNSQEEAFATEGLYHMAVAIADLRSQLIRSPEDSGWFGRKYGQGGSDSEIEALRGKVSDSNKEYEQALQSLNQKKLVRAGEFLKNSLALWPKNKLAQESRMEIAPKLDQIEKDTKAISAMFKDGQFVGLDQIEELERIFKEISALTMGLDGLESMVADARRVLAEFNKKIEQSQGAVKHECWFEAFGEVEEALKKWPGNSRAGEIRSGILVKFPGFTSSMNDIVSFEREQDYEKALVVEKKLVSICPKDEKLAEMEKDLQAKKKQREEAYTQAKFMENAYKLGEALDSFKKFNFKEDAKRVAGELGKYFEQQGKYSQAIAFYDEGGCAEDAKRLRLQHHVIGDVVAYYNEKTGAEVFEENTDKVCVIRTSSIDKIGIASGFLVSKEGYIVTNNHVANDSVDVIKVRFPKDTAWRNARLVKSIPSPDLALIQIVDLSNFQVEPVQVVKKVDTKVGAHVFALGYPDVAITEENDALLKSTFTEGVLSNSERVVGGGQCLQTTAAINHGNSGGPLFDSLGWVIGVNTFGIEPEAGIQGVFFAIKSDDIWAHLLAGIPDIERMK